MRAHRWLRAEYAAGRRKPPLSCDACGQTEGVIQAHAEDYSEPFGPHIDQYGLCYRCHMMVHCRFNNEDAWQAYKQQVRDGRVFEPIGRNFWLFCRQSLRTKGEGVPFRQVSPRTSTLLDSIV
jgi:hypothetical protein